MDRSRGPLVKKGPDGTGFFLVIITAASEKEGRKIAKILVQKGLAACVNVVPGMRSLFYWEGNLREEKETLLLVKTVGGKLRPMVQEVKKTHSYSVPEVIFINLDGGEKNYLDWVKGEIGKRRKKY